MTERIKIVILGAVIVLLLGGIIFILSGRGEKSENLTNPSDVINVMEENVEKAEQPEATTEPLKEAVEESKSEEIKAVELPFMPVR